MNDKTGQPKQIQIQTGDEHSRGRYSNNMIITHTPEEFMLDWLLTAPNGAHLVSRIIISPGHVKRIIKALEENLSKYESRFGGVKEIEPSEQTFH